MNSFRKYGLRLRMIDLARAFDPEFGFDYG